MYMLSGKTGVQPLITILVLGGTGTFGRAFTKYFLAHAPPNDVLRLLSNDEYSQYMMQQQYRDQKERLTFMLGDIRDVRRLELAMYKADVVIHAAALKQVPILQNEPFEAVKTNVDGTLNVAEAALNAGVKTSVLISSDKSPHPENTYGATKMLSEKLWLGAASYTGGRPGMVFAAVRYGNVLGSRGSVAEVWREQAKSGAITVTDPNATRFSLTPSQAVGLVYDMIATEEFRPETIVVPILPSYRVRELAFAVAPLAVWEITGLRPGEKMHEELATGEEMANAGGVRTCGGQQICILHPNLPVSTPAKPLTSGLNDKWLDSGELKRLLEEIEKEGLLGA